MTFALSPVRLEHGERYGKLTVLRKRGRRYRCGCECGFRQLVSAKALMSGRVKACDRCTKQAATTCRTRLSMTDQEITKLCAEAMGYRFVEHYGYPHGVSMTYMDEHDEKHYYWRPLIDDLQAMALVKKFGLTIDPQEDHPPFTWRVCAPVDFRDWDNAVTVTGKDLNRAICECVAELHAALSPRT